MEGPLVVATGLTRRYGPVAALDAVDLELPSGTVGLLGPNGAGKTTLIRLILGLTRPDAGSLRVLGMQAPQERLEIRRRVGYSPETEAYFPGMTALDAVTYSARLSGLPRREGFKRAHELLHYVRLDEARYRRLETFSTGMKQRVKIAQALVHNPELAILDEPTAGLDATGRDELLDLIRDVAATRRVSVVLSTHILSDVERACDHAAILHQGRRVAAGPVRELVGAGGDFELRFDGDGARFRRELEARGVRVASSGPAALTVEGDSAAVFAAAVAAGSAIRHYARRRRTLDDAYLALVDPSRS